MSVKVEKGDAEDGGFVVVKGNIHVTRRELEVLAWIGYGLSNEEIGKKMNVRANTVRNHAYNVMKKLGANNRTHAMVLAAENGMITIGHEKSLVRPMEKDYMLCWYCHRAFTMEEIIVMETEPITIDHVTYEPPPREICPYQDCQRKIDSEDYWWYWTEVRKDHPEFPKLPEKGKVYRAF